MNEFHSQKRDSLLSKYPSIVTTIFFDLDNTLLATRKIDELACEDVCSWLQKVHGVRPDTSSSICSTFLQNYRQAPAPPGYKESGDSALREWRRQLWRSTLKPAELDNLTDVVFATWHVCRLHRLQLTEEVQQLLVDLNKDYNIAIITNGPSAAQWEKIRACNLRRLVPAIVVSGDLRIRKPDKAIYFRTCDLLKVSPSECLMVGDKPETDILGAINAGLAATVLVTAHQAAAGGSKIHTAPPITHAQDHSHTGMCAEPSNPTETRECSLPGKSRSSLNHSVPEKANGFDSTAACSYHNSIGGSKNGLNSKAMCKSLCVANGTVDFGVSQNGPVSDNPRPAENEHADAVMHLATTSASPLAQSQVGCVEHAVDAAVRDGSKTAHYDRREPVDAGRCSDMNGLGELLNGSSSTPCCGQSSEPVSDGRPAPLADFVVDSVLDLPTILLLLNNNNRL